MEELIRERSIKGIVIGLPLNMDGSEGPRAQSSRAYARNLSVIGLPILLVTHDVEEALLLATRICIVDEGRLQACVDATAFDAADDPVIAALRDARLRRPAGHS